ncbi:MAG: ferritin-like domain-containing protein [Bryobacteraceae bacterium]
MAIDTNEIRSTLNDLISTCKDGENGFRSAAEGVKSSDLQSLFQKLSSQRAQFASELQSEVAKLGGSPDTSGSVAGAMHRGWLNVKSAVTGQDDAAVIAECERGEDAAKEAYEKALAKGLPSDLQSVVQRQSREVHQAHDQVSALKHRTSGASSY